MKVATWNVNSIRQRLDRVLAWTARERPDILCLQETKCLDEAFPREAFTNLGYQVELYGQKTYNGVAILSLAPMTDVVRGWPRARDLPPLPLPGAPQAPHPISEPQAPQQLELSQALDPIGAPQTPTPTTVPRVQDLPAAPAGHDPSGLPQADDLPRALQAPYPMTAPQAHDLPRAPQAHDLNTERRLIAATVRGIRIIAAYIPNGQSLASEKFPYKLAWLDRLAAMIEATAKPSDPLLLLGDFNIAPDDRDVHEPELWRGQVLFHPLEHAALGRLTGWGLFDLFRKHHPEAGFYSWWDYRMLGFPKNLGLRIDLMLGTAPILARCASCSIVREERKGKLPSDHAPVLAEIAESSESSGIGELSEAGVATAAGISTAPVTGAPAPAAAPLQVRHLEVKTALSPVMS
ncbi:MAG TPA: exodeoxyribonuclease III [Thermoanaerobaculia bacterium]|nr:exodeoxyribonuclease III [Thermoanaerobaculia bacterium]